MGDDLASSNVNRTSSLAATSIAIFTFMLIFLYPRFAAGQIESGLFQITLGVIGVATFSFVFASFYYYGSSLRTWLGEAERARYPVTTAGEIASGCWDTRSCSLTRA